MNYSRLITAFLLPSALLLTCGGASAQCCGGGGSASPVSVRTAAMPAPVDTRAMLQKAVSTAGSVKAKLGSRTKTLKQSSGGGPVPYDMGPSRDGGNPPMPGESPSNQLQDSLGNPYTGSPAHKGPENEETCSPPSDTGYNENRDGKGETKGQDVDGTPKPDPQPNSNANASAGDRERPASTFNGSPPAPTNDKQPGGGAGIPSSSPQTLDSRGGGNSTSGGNMEGTPATPLDVPARITVAQRLGATPNGKLQTGYILLKQPAVGAAPANPVKLSDYEIRGQEALDHLDSYTGTGWKLNVITTSAGVTFQREDTTAGTMTFSFYNADQVDFSLTPPAAYSGQVPIQEQILSLTTTGNPDTVKYNRGMNTVVREHGSTVSIRTVWMRADPGIVTPASTQYRLTIDTFSPSLNTLWEEWSSVRTGAQRVVTVKQEYRVVGTATAKAEKRTTYQLFDWGEEIVEEREIIDPADSTKDLVTSYTFWTPVAPGGGYITDDPNYGWKKLTTYPDGSWVAGYRARVSGTEGAGASDPPTAGGGTAVSGKSDLIIHEFSPVMNLAPPATTATTANLDALKPSCRYVRTRLRTDYRQERQEYVLGNLVSQTLPGADSMPSSEYVYEFTDATHYFVTVTDKDGSLFFNGLPGDVYCLKENTASYSSAADLISHTVYKRATASASASLPFYTESTSPSGTDPYRITDVLTDPERLPCKMSRTVVDRSNGTLLSTEEYVVTLLDDYGNPAAKTLLDRQVYTLDTNGQPTVLTYLDGRTETWYYDSPTRTTYKDAREVTTVQDRDEFGRVKMQAINGSAAYSYSGSLGSVSIPAQQYWTVTDWVYAARSGGLTGSRVTITTEARDGGLSGSVPSTGSVPWRRTTYIEQDGAGRTALSTNVLGRTDYYHYSLASGGGTIVKHSTLSNPASPFHSDVEERYRDGRVKSVTGLGVTDTWYTYGSPAAWRESQSMGFDATLTASLGVRTTETDPLGRVTKITQPRSSTGTTLNTALDEVRTYNSEGLLAVRQLPSTGSSSINSFHDLYSYTWSGGSSTESPHRVVTSVRSVDTTMDSGDTNREINESWLEYSSSLWWNVSMRKMGDSTVNPSYATPLSTNRTAAGPMNLASGYARVKVTSLGSTEELITARIASGAVHETKHSRNGTLVGGSLLHNGLPIFIRQNGNQLKLATFSPLREPLMEPDNTSAYWVTRTLAPDTGYATQRIGPNTGETLEYYTGQDVRTGRVYKRTPLTAGQGPTYYTYNAAGQVTTEWGSGTYPVAYYYDEWMRLINLTTFRSDAGQTVNPDTNPASWVPATGTAGSASTVWAYPPWLDLVISKTHAAGSPAAVSWAYHRNGQLASRTGQRGLATAYTYNTKGQLDTVNYADAATPDVTLAWDSAGRNTGRTDGIGSWTISYAADGRLLEETTGATGRSSKWTLDSYGRRQYFDARFNSGTVSPQASYTYDSYGRLQQIQTPMQTILITSYAANLRPFTLEGYDAFGNIIMEQSSGFSANGELTSRGITGYNSYATPYILFSNGYTRSYGRVSKITDSMDGGEWNYEYDSRSQVSKAYKKFTASPNQIMAGTQNQYTYDQTGNRLQWREGGSSTLDAGLRDNYYGGTSTAPVSAPAAGNSANALNQYLSVRRPQAFDVTGTRATGTTAIAVTVPPAAAATPAYQQNSSTGLYFRQEVTHNSATNDKYSPVTVSTAGLPTDSWQQYVPPAAEILTYDADGNLKTDGRWTYTWDEENRLVQMETAAQTGTNPVPGTRLVFTYDGLSRRTKKEVYSTQPSAWTLTLREHYVYDGWNLVLTARENNATPTTSVKRHACYVWGPDLGSLPYGRSDWQRAGGVDGLLMVMDGVNSSLAYQNVDYNGAAAGLGSPSSDPTDDNYFPITDHLGNIRALYKTTATITPTLAAVLDYDPFGREMRSTGRAADIVPFHFSTKFTDPETGFSYYGYRFYDPVNGRWINRDPIAEQGGVNLYRMVNNNPISFIDRHGLEAFPFLENPDPASPPSSLLPPRKPVPDETMPVNSLLFPKLSGEILKQTNFNPCGQHESNVSHKDKLIGGVQTDDIWRVGRMNLQGDINITSKFLYNKEGCDFHEVLIIGKFRGLPDKYDFDDPFNPDRGLGMFPAIVGAALQAFELVDPPHMINFTGETTIRSSLVIACCCEFGAKLVNKTSPR